MPFSIAPAAGLPVRAASGAFPIFVVSSFVSFFNYLEVLNE
jgi:hypothetical protein